MRPLSLAPWLRLIATAAAGALLLAPSIAAGVLVVDPAGGGDFTTLDPAFTAAVDGDIIVIKPGDYGTGSLFLEINGKALTVVGDTGGETILPTIFVHDLAANETLVLRHVTVVPTGLSFLLESTVYLQLTSGGRVHIEDCVLEGADGAGNGATSATPGMPGLRVTGSGSVAVHRSTITGGQGVSTTAIPFPGGQLVNSVGGAAVRLEGGQLALYGVTATGGQGGSGAATSVAGKPGGSGLLATGATVVVAGSSFTGGEGGSGSPAAPSGTGATVIGTTASIGELDSQFTGGTGAQGLVVTLATHVQHPGAAWTLVTAAPVRSGELGSITASGPPNELFGLFFGLGMGYLPKASFQGVFLPSSPFFGPLLIATTNGAGVWSAPFLAPNLETFGLEGLLHIDQALMQQDTGLVLSSATAYIQVQRPN